jgi:hypothetical protein
VVRFLEFLLELILGRDTGALAQSFKLVFSSLAFPFKLFEFVFKAIQVQSLCTLVVNGHRLGHSGLTGEYRLACRDNVAVTRGVQIL